MGDEGSVLRGWYGSAAAVRTSTPCACTPCAISGALRDLLRDDEEATAALGGAVCAQLIAEDGVQAIPPCSQGSRGLPWGALCGWLARAMVGAAECGVLWPKLRPVVGLPLGDAATGRGGGSGDGGTGSLSEGAALFTGAVRTAVAATSAGDGDKARSALRRAIGAAARAMGGDTLGAVRRLLRMRATPGSTRSLPPTRSALLAAAATLHPNSGLTVAARALAKHAQRCSSGFWGSAAYSGQEADKNAAAEEVMRQLLDGAAWLNCHRLPHCLETFEVRIAAGYGARWVGGAFRGFLEPHTAGGHESRWKH